MSYNLALQGELLNRRNACVLPASAIRRTAARLGLSYASLRLEAPLTWVSPALTVARPLVEHAQASFLPLSAALRKGGQRRAGLLLAQVGR